MFPVPEKVVQTQKLLEEARERVFLLSSKANTGEDVATELSAARAEVKRLQKELYVMEERADFYDGLMTGISVVLGLALGAQAAN